MKRSPHFTLAQQLPELLAHRYPAIHKMVAEIFARVEPDGYAETLEAFRRDWDPTPEEEPVVARLADLMCCKNGCTYLETEILTREMAACAIPGEVPDRSLGRAYLKDMNGPNLIDKISRYSSQAGRDVSRCISLLRRDRTAARKSRSSRVHYQPIEGITEEQFANLKNCTNVVQ